MPFLNDEQIAEIGFKKVGKKVRISSLASFDKPEHISIGDYSRVDDFCALSGHIEIGRNVHIAVMNSIVASSSIIKLSDFSGLAFGCRLFSSSDDYSGESLTNPTVPTKYKNIQNGNISLGRHVILGTNSVVFPGVTIEEGCAFGANSVVLKSTESWGIYVGQPARRVKERSKGLLSHERAYLEEEGSSGQ
jgi:galactoside O-acetyltransferase